ncbi:MAG: hypothetical protein OEZ55_04835 [Nitrospinota bacterium]|nr:hypothetical protein [Nitrospinota bacterium]MDH5755977.1 hypothetical protein [Nitrospinota bacterium]
MDIDKIEYLSERERRIARALLDDGSISLPEFREFLLRRERTDKNGKAHLGDILIKEGHITQQTLDEFFQDNNRLYLALLDKMREGGYISPAQYAIVIKDEVSKTNVVSALEKNNIMTRANFVRLCANRMNLFKLGEWLVMRKKIEPKVLERALEEQRVNNLEDYLVHKGLVKKERISELVEIMGLH